MSDIITIRGARQHNLKNIDLDIPRNCLVVITGPSGSGKSSLAFDTIYAEGQRRYVESLSAYARQFLDLMDKPDADSIEGLSPAVAIQQRGMPRTPRSTVGTLTEVYDHLRLLFARVGTPHCPVCGQVIVRETVAAVVDRVLALPEGQRLQVLAPLVRNAKGGQQSVFVQLRKAGYLRVRVDGAILPLDRAITLDKRAAHSIDAVVDRLVVRGNLASRLADSLETALDLADGTATLDIVGKGDWTFSTRFACTEGHFEIHAIEPRLFSFNSPYGACPTCDGLGTVSNAGADGELFSKPPSSSDPAPGDPDPRVRDQTCPGCHGTRLRAEALAITLADSTIAEIARLPIDGIRRFFQTLDLRDNAAEIAAPLIREIESRLGFLADVGVGYLALNRRATTLSGGEFQRIRLATQIGTRLVGVLYVLDEPSIGLHPRDNRKLIKAFCNLRDLGNSVIVVEHDREAMEMADYLIDLGPGAGEHGGRVIAKGAPRTVMADERSLTGDYLSGRKTIPPPPDARQPHGHLSIRGARGHNLQDVDVDIPLGVFVCVTGVSGSGKSSLIDQTLYPALARHFHRANADPLPHRAIEGMGQLDKVIRIDQSPIGRTPRSNAATYTGAFTAIRDLYAQLPESRVRGYGAGRFSFNVKGGRCEACQGDGVRRIEMHFLPDVFVTCDTCAGTRYNRETLEVRYKGSSIADALNMTVAQAQSFFRNIPAAQRHLNSLATVGLGYLRLGQAATSLSGGEAQRVKLATELARSATGKTLYLLDEPTTGLHFDDIRVLIEVLDRLVDRGNTALVIEHNLDVIKRADWIIDLGPDAGENGGHIVAAGTPEAITRVPTSHTGRFLKSGSRIGAD